MKVIRQFLIVAVLLAAGPVRAQKDFHPDYHPVVPGLDYAHVQMKNWDKNEPWSIHIARLDRTAKNLHIASMLSQNEIFGIAPISAQVKEVPKQTGHPLVAINTDFCNVTKNHPYRGTSFGIQIMEGQLISPPFKNSFWLNEDGSMGLGKTDSKFTATLPDGKSFWIGMNHEGQPKRVTLFTRILGPSTRAKNSLELVLEDPAHQPLAWHIGQSYALRIKAINPSGDTALSNSIAVLSFGKTVTNKASGLKVGDEIKLELASTPDFSKAVMAIGCIFPVVQNGQALKVFEGNSYLVKKHPRTAIGFNEHYFYMVVVDGRQKKLSLGMFPNELAKFMVALGCTEAMNMDGGGSSTFWLTGKTRNSPSDKHERHLANGLTIVQRKN